ACSLLLFLHAGATFPCAVIRWFDIIGDSADKDTGLWVVRPGFAPNHSPNISIIYVDSIYRAAHLIPVYAHFHHSYYSFRFYYVNKYAYYHAFEIAF
ncbi:uncharacterized protein BJ212DRAFT_1327519, partial [Suillus subaureus]